MLKPQPDVLFLIHARIDSGSKRGAPQLRKDVQVLKKAATEIERLRAVTRERAPDPGQQWKCGDEFLPFHPAASHVPPDYRDGWNRCYAMALARSAGK